MSAPFSIGTVGHFGLAVQMEDPGHEIAPEGPGSKNIGLWFYDPDGYRLELTVPAAARFAQKN